MYHQTVNNVSLSNSTNPNAWRPPNLVADHPWERVFDDIPLVDRENAEALQDFFQPMDFLFASNLLPGAVLLPCPRGKKGCRDFGWQNTPPEVMSDPEYLERLAKASGIAVLLGEKSGGIVTIDCDSNHVLAAMLDANPNMRESLITRGARGGNIWLKIDGDYPPLTSFKIDGVEAGEWRSDGGQTMIAGTHPSGCDYVAENMAAPVSIRYEEINWPSNFEPPQCEVGQDVDVHRVLVEQYGEPVFLTADRNGEMRPTSVNEAYFAAKYAVENVVGYAVEEHEFYLYDATSGIFEPLSTDEIKQLISSDILAVSRQNASLAPVAKMRTDRLLNAIVSQLRGIAKPVVFKRSSSPVVHLGNCVLEIRDSQITTNKFSPAFMSRNSSKIHYDPEARCTRFLEELLLPAVAEEDVVLIQKYFGQCLIGDNLVQKLLILTGPGGRGKSQLLDILQRIIGLENVTQLRTSLLNERFELYRYRNKSLLIGNDVDSNFLSAKGASVIKGLVGGDRFDAEQKSGTGSFLIEGRFNIVVSANTRLRVRLQGDIEAWGRRLLIVPVEGPRPLKPIPNFGALLVQEEGAGIVNWAVEGVRMLLHDIGQTGGLSLASSQSQRISSLLAESDSVRHFLKRNVHRVSGSSLAVQSLLSRYSIFCADNSWHQVPETVFQRQLSDLMLELFQAAKSHHCVYHGNIVRGFSGVGYIDPIP